MNYRSICALFVSCCDMFLINVENKLNIIILLIYKTVQALGHNCLYGNRLIQGLTPFLPYILICEEVLHQSFHTDSSHWTKVQGQV